MKLILQAVHISHFQKYMVGIFLLKYNFWSFLRKGSDSGNQDGARLCKKQLAWMILVK